MPPSDIPLAAFAVPLSEVRGAWLEVTCCTGCTYMPIARAIADRQVGTLGGLLLRLRCHRCRQAPRGVALVRSADQADQRRRGDWGAWRVVLIEPGQR